MTTLNLERLTRTDLEALAAFKLFEEIGIGIHECREAVRSADGGWLLAFLRHGGDRIASARLDGRLLSRARAHVSA
jgi:hypothetical protein